MNSFIADKDRSEEQITDQPVRLIICAALIVGRDKRAFSIAEMPDLLRFVIAAALAAMLSAVVGVNTYVIFGVVPAGLYWPILLTWFGSTAIGIVLFTPFFVNSVRNWPSLGSHARYAEFATASVVLALAAFLWQVPAFTRNADEPVILVVILVLLWITFRFPPAAMTLAVFLFAIAAVVGAVLRLSHEPVGIAVVSTFALQLISGSVGHELRPPLGVMNNAVYFLKMILSKADEKTKEYLEIIKQEIDNSQRTINDLLDFARTRPPQTRTVTACELIYGSLKKATYLKTFQLKLL